MSDQQVEALEWMTHDFFQSVLEKHEGATVTLKKFTLKSATKAGENFASAVYRVCMDYELDGANKDVSFVMKTSSTNLELSEMLEKFDVFVGESHFYQNVLQECYKLIDDNKYKLAPRWGQLVWSFQRFHRKMICAVLTDSLIFYRNMWLL